VRFSPAEKFAMISQMTTVAAFNALFKSFVEDLSCTFPEERRLALFCESFDDLVKVNARKPLELFVAAMAPHAQLVMTKDPALFDQPLEVGIDISALWKSKDVSDVSREAIWKYLHSLFLLGTTAVHVPPQLLETIESVAQTCADRMQSGGDGGEHGMDLAGMASMFVNGMSSISGGNGGAGQLPAGLLGALGAPAGDKRP
jgi:hypothetical protein